MKIVQAETSNPTSQQYVLKKRDDDCISTFHFGKDRANRQKTNITINLFPIGFENPFETFNVVLLDNPSVMTTDVSGLNKRYSLSFVIENSPTNLAAQGEVNIHSVIRPSIHDTRYCVWGQTKGFVGWTKLSPSPDPYSTFGQITISIQDVNENKYIPFDSSYEPVEFKECDDDDPKTLAVLFRSKIPAYLNFTLDMSGRNMYPSVLWGTSQDNKMVFFSGQNKIRVSHSALMVTNKTLDYQYHFVIFLVYADTEITNCRINSQYASITEEWMTDVILRLHSIFYRPVDHDKKILVAERMSENEIEQCREWAKYNIYTEPSNIEQL